MTKGKANISYQVILGDSLSDSGQLQHSKPLLAGATALTSSPYGRFSDGYTWADDLARTAALDILKEQLILYITKAIQPEKLDDNAALEIEQFKEYIRTIDLEKFHPDTFNFDKLKDSYLKRHLLKEHCLSFFTNQLKSDSSESKQLLSYLKQLPLACFNPDTFNLDQILTGYGNNTLKQKIDVNELDTLVVSVKETYQTEEAHHNNIFDALDNKFPAKHLNENIKNFLYGSFSLGDYRRVLFQGHNFVRRFAEGGLSANAYSPFLELQAYSLILQQIKYTIGEFQLSFSYLLAFIRQFFKLLTQIIGARATLCNLDGISDSLLKDDVTQKISKEEKEKTLVTEWTGANDFITMNAFSSEEICESAVKARIDNIIKLADAGYKNFLLMDLPDLCKTPRYLNRSEEERNEVSRLIQYFNKLLTDELEALSESHSELNIKLFPLSQGFDAIYKNPELFGLSKNINKTDPILSIKPNDDDKMEYMFWDDVHPSNRMHHALAQQVYKFAKENYALQPAATIKEPCCPIEIATGLLAMFKEKYNSEYQDYSNQFLNPSRFFGLGLKKQHFSDVKFNPSNLDESKSNLAKLFILSKQDTLVKQSMIHLGWLEKNGQIPKNNYAPILKQAYELANNATEKRQETQINEHLYDSVPINVF